MRVLSYIAIAATILHADASEHYNGQDTRVLRFKEAYVPSRAKPQVDKVVRRILLNKRRYQSVAKDTGVPWFVIASLHNMESSGSFRHHLHEGSSLSGRTRWIPKGRPYNGSPPFTWEESAEDALAYDKMGSKRWGYLFDMLWSIEGYNGTGYWRYHRSTPSPYLYAKTSIERAGKYVSDGKWSSTARSKQVGVVAILKLLDKKIPLGLNELQ